MKSQKHLFQLEKGTHYLNCAYKAPLSKAGEAACLKALKRGRNPYHITQEDFFTETIEVRKLFAELIHAKPQQIAIIPSTSYGFSSVLNNIKGKKKGNAITIQEEFPSGYFSLQRWCTDNKNDLIVVKPSKKNPGGASWNQKLLKQINKQTSVVLISSVHWMNGVKFDLKAIGKKCSKMGAKFIVDGTQSVGASPMDIQKYKIDVLVCASYKWLMGAYSIALAYIGDDFQNGRPLEEAWINRVKAVEFSKLSDYEEVYEAGAGRYNVGETSNLLTLPILKASLSQILAWKPIEIQKYCNALIEPLRIFLKGIGVELGKGKYFSNHLFSLQLPEAYDSIALRANLKKHQVYASIRGQYLRISVNVFNDKKDINKLIEVIKMSKK